MAVSFNQFKYCNYCKIHYNNLKSHKYVKKHKECVNKIIKKFLLKIETVKEIFLTKLNENNLIECDMNDDFWCPICCASILKHDLIDDVKIPFLNFMKHLSSISHKEEVIKFWQNEKPSAAMINYYIEENTFNKLYEMAKFVINSKQIKNNYQLTQIKNVLKEKDQRQKSLYRSDEIIPYSSIKTNNMDEQDNIHKNLKVSLNSNFYSPAAQFVTSLINYNQTNSFNILDLKASVIASKSKSNHFLSKPVNNMHQNLEEFEENNSCNEFNFNYNDSSIENSNGFKEFFNNFDGKQISKSETIKNNSKETSAYLSDDFNIRPYVSKRKKL